MKKITLDTNILVDIEEKRDGYKDVQKMVELDNQKFISLYIPVPIAIEKSINGTTVDNFSEFINYLKQLGIKNPKTLTAATYFGFGFFLDNLIMYDENGPEFKLAKEIEEFLFPNIEHDYQRFCQEHNWDPHTKQINPKFRNMKIDSLVLWCHIHHKNDVLVTRDKNFKIKLTSTKKFKNIKILKPSELIENLSVLE